MNRSRTIFLSISLLFITTGSVAAVPSIDGHPNPGSSNSYIVTFKDEVGSEESRAVAESIGRARGFAIKHSYKRAVKGFSATIHNSQLQAVRNDPRVASVTEDSVVYALAQTNPKGISRANALPAQNPNRGTGVGVAVIDSGIDLEHPDLKDNIVASKNCIDPTKNGDDDNNHGSHVAGTIAAADNTTGVVGVASGAKLIAVKVLASNGSGYTSQVICGIDWVTENAATYNIKVANMSLGGSGSSDNNCGLTNGDPYHQAICKSTAAGITYVVAAGNSGVNASKTVPAAYNDTVITVAALNDTDGRPGRRGSSNTYGSDDTFPQFSNYGNVVDIAAPGTNIYSANKAGGYMTMSGTSMAAPHVAGAAAMYINSHPDAKWAEVLQALKSKAETSSTAHKITSRHPEPVLWTVGL